MGTVLPLHTASSWSGTVNNTERKSKIKSYLKNHKTNDSNLVVNACGSNGAWFRTCSSD